MLQYLSFKILGHSQMNKHTLLFHSLLILSSAIFCQKSIAEPLNIDEYKIQLKKYHDSGAYHKEISQITYQIEQYIKEKAKNPQEKYAIVLDIDETCLSNYYNIVERDFSGDREAIHRDILKANAKAIPASRHLFQFAKAHHVDIFFITGRYESEKQATIKNLSEQGFQGWTDIFFKPKQNQPSNPSLENYKVSARKQLAQKGYTILASVGDQESDLKGGYALETFKLPNPFYKAV